MSWIYIVAVIIFAIVSNVNKANKAKGKDKGKDKGEGAPPGGMPTFGGGEDNPLRRIKRTIQQQGSGFPAPGNQFPQQSRDILTGDEGGFPKSRERNWLPGPDAETGEGVSLEQGKERDGVDIRLEKMQRDLERLHAHFDQMAGADKGETFADSDRSADAPAQSNLAHNPEELRSGLIWAEILGPPRSRRPHAFRKEG